MESKNIENVFTVTFLKNTGHYLGNFLDIIILLCFIFSIVYCITSWLRNIVYPKIFKSVVSHKSDEFWNELYVSLMKVYEEETKNIEAHLYTFRDLSLAQMIKIDNNIRVHKAIINRLMDGDFFESYSRKGRFYQYYSQQIDTALIADILSNITGHINNICNMCKENDKLLFQYKEYHTILEKYISLCSQVKPKDIQK